MNQLERATNFARTAHQGQMYGDASYDKHLADVESILRRFGFDGPQLLSAAWLHDSVEDAGVQQSQIVTEFGSEIASLVWAVTDEEGVNRHQRKVASYEKMLRYPKAIILKLADRIANVESSLANNHKLVQMYMKEYEAFRERLFGPSNAYDPRALSMWRHLDRLMDH